MGINACLQEWMRRKESRRVEYHGIKGRKPTRNAKDIWKILHRFRTRYIPRGYTYINLVNFIVLMNVAILYCSGSKKGVIRYNLYFNMEGEK